MCERLSGVYISIQIQEEGILPQMFTYLTFGLLCFRRSKFAGQVTIMYVFYAMRELLLFAVSIPVYIFFYKIELTFALLQS